jgi:hypothetical protein
MRIIACSFYSWATPGLNLKTQSRRSWPRPVAFLQQTYATFGKQH